MIAARFPFLRRRMGQDVRAWPMLALLLLVVLVAAGCVLWFMREAMRNERLAVRQKLAEAYRGQLALLQARAEEQWRRGLERLDQPAAAPVLFARAAREGWADSVLCFDAGGGRAYPAEPRGASGEGETLQAELRALMQAGKGSEVVKFVTEKFAGTQHASVVDSHGRLIAANAELLAIETLGDRSDPRYEPIATRLKGRVSDYESVAMPAAQRLFLMRELRRLAPGSEFPTLPAEELAASYLEAHPQLDPVKNLRSTRLPDLWATASPGGGALALFFTATLRAKLESLVRDPSLPEGVRVTAVAPGEDAMTESTLAAASLAPLLPGWRLALSFDDRALFDTAADKKVAAYRWIGGAVIAAMTVLAVFIARGFGRQMHLARLKNDLVATVSHELKTPLTAMRALVETLLDAETFDATTTREYLQLLARENSRLSRLIDNFLTFSRLERNKFSFAFTRLRPEALAEGALAAMGERSQAPGCHLETQVADDLPEIVGDSDALITALLNLLDNACKYSPGDKRIALRVEARGGSVRFVVEDHGIGLSPADSRRIFGRFYQVDQRLARTAGGCGLGLSIVQSIVAAHRGSVEVSSRLGHGSTFTILLPGIGRARV